MAQDPRRGYGTLPGGCQVGEGLWSPSAAIASGLIMPRTPSTPSQPVLSPGRWTEEEELPCPRGVVGLVSRRAPALPACVSPPSARLSSWWSRVAAVAAAIASAFPQQKGAGKSTAA